MNTLFFYLCLILASFFLESQANEGTHSIGADPIQSPPLLPPLTFGKPDAPLHITLFHSLNCWHCKDIKQNLIPVIKKQFVDQGKVRLTLVDFPTNVQALNAAKVAWASGTVEMYEKISQTLMAEDEKWGVAPESTEKICQIVVSNQFMTLPQCQKAINDDSLGKRIVHPSFEFGKSHKIDYVPVFLFNGHLKDNPSTLTIADIEEELKKIQKPH